MAVRALFRRLRAASAAVRASWAGQRAAAVVSFLLHKRHPLYKLLYVLLAVGGYVLFAMHVYPRLPNRFAADYHRLGGLAVFCVAFSAWSMLCHADPGVLTAETASAATRAFPPSAIFPPDATTGRFAQCRSCLWAKPARAKHCALCDVCVANFDHHCYFVDNCIGHRTRRLFLAFLVTNAALCDYGVALALAALWDAAENAQERGQLAAAEGWARGRLTRIQFWLTEHELVVFLLLFCTLLGVVCAGFLMWQLYLICRGMTTNEHAKWAARRRAGGTDEPNVYHRGAWRNLADVIFPIDFSISPPSFGLDQSAPREAEKSEDKKKED